MSQQVLSAKRTAYYARRAGVPFERMLARGGSHWFKFRTYDHEHGYAKFYKGGFVVEFVDHYEGSGLHFSTCEEAYPLDYEPHPRIVGGRQDLRPGVSVYWKENLP